MCVINLGLFLAVTIRKDREAVDADTGDEQHFCVREDEGNREPLASPAIHNIIINSLSNF